METTTGIRTEIQTKYPGLLSLENLIAAGAQALGSTTQVDYYLDAEIVKRVREENGEFYYTEKDQHLRASRSTRVKQVRETPISRQHAYQLLKSNRVTDVISKSRRYYRWKDAIVAHDIVEYLGEYTEIHADSEEVLAEVTSMLGVSPDEGTSESYLDLRKARKLPKLIKDTLVYHTRIGELSFGLMSGVMTTLGVLSGVVVSGATKLSVIAAIIAVAISDSVSDGYSIYVSRSGERGCSPQVARRYMWGTIGTKVLLPIVFLIPLFAIRVRLVAISIDFLIGALVLGFLSAEQAIVREERIWIRIRNNVRTAFGIVVGASLVGFLISKLTHVLHW